VLQGRYKSILCETDQYLAELVRYIHLNPVRAKLVNKPEEYEYSGHLEYLGMEARGLVDADGVLRYFGARKKEARERYRVFVREGMKQGHREELYKVSEGRLLGSEEFVEEAKHRVGEIPRGARRESARGDRKDGKQLDPRELIKRVEKVTGVSRAEMRGRNRRGVEVKEAMILAGVRNGARQSELARELGLDESAISRRLTRARAKVAEESGFAKLVVSIERSLHLGKKK
jgi:REP-associated tyrosine transposase